MTPTTADRAFFAALLSSDGAALDALLTDDFILVDVMAGGVIGREALVDVVASRSVSSGVPYGDARRHGPAVRARSVVDGVWPAHTAG
jgi:uncharacterized protein DUF4440